MLTRNERGDTIIEVILACAVFSMVAISAFSIMQRGTATAYDALERSQVRLQLNSQAELLQYLRDQYIVWNQNSGAALQDGTAWEAATNRSQAAPDEAYCLNYADPQDAFYLTVDIDTQVVTKRTFQEATGFPTPGQGIWVIRAASNGTVSPKYADYYIMACWPSTASNMQTISTVVRLYDPIF